MCVYTQKKLSIVFFVVFFLFVLFVAVSGQTGRSFLSIIYSLPMIHVTRIGRIPLDTLVNAFKNVLLITILQMSGHYLFIMCVKFKAHLETVQDGLLGKQFCFKLRFTVCIFFAVRSHS